VKASQAELDAAFELARKIVAAEDALHRAVNQIRELRAQASIVRRQIADSPKPKEIGAALDALDAKLAPIEESLIQVHMKSSEGNLAFPNELNEEIYGLFYSVDSSDTAPTESVKSVYAALSRRLDEQLAKWKSVSSTDVPALDQRIRALSLPSLSVGAGAPVPPPAAASHPSRRERNEDERRR
jgi:seryl-tRNA synthetase